MFRHLLCQLRQSWVGRQRRASIEARSDDLVEEIASHLEQEKGSERPDWLKGLKAFEEQAEGGFKGLKGG